MSSKTFQRKTYITDLEKLFRKHGTRERSEGAKAYMRNQFEYIGLDTTTRRHLQKEFHQMHGLPPKEELEPLVKTLWKNPHREMQYFAMELLEKYHKEFPEKFLSLFVYMITHKSWWDTVDFIAPKLVARYFTLYPETIEPVTQEWISSGNIWLMRTALIFQNLQKKKINEQLLFSLILRCMDHPDFFIRKGIGWALRQYARTNPRSVRKFVMTNGSTLSALSKKEALKYL